MNVTLDERVRIQDLILRLRVEAEPVGCMHSFWDMIFDLESLLRGEATILNKTPAEFIALAESYLPLEALDKPPIFR